MTPTHGATESVVWWQSKMPMLLRPCGACAPLHGASRRAHGAGAAQPRVDGERVARDRIYDVRVLQGKRLAVSGANGGEAGHLCVPGCVIPGIEVNNVLCATLFLHTVNGTVRVLWRLQHPHVTPGTILQHNELLTGAISTEANCPNGFVRVPVNCAASGVADGASYLSAIAIVQLIWLWHSPW